MAASISYQTAASQAGSGPYSIAVTVASAAGQERLVALSGIANGSGGTVTFSSVTIDGQTATQVGPYARSDVSGTGTVLSLWRATGTSGTSINVAATASAAMFDLRCLVWSLNNAGSVVDYATVGVSTSTVAQSLDLDTAANGVAVAATMAYDSGTASATWAGLTERFDGLSLYGTDCTGGADAVTASASTPLSVTVTHGYSSNYRISAVSASFNPAATGTTLAADAGIYTLTGSAVIEHFVMPLGAAGA